VPSLQLCTWRLHMKMPLPHSSAGDFTLRLVLSVSQRDFLFRSNLTGFIILLRILDTCLPTARPTWVCQSKRVVVWGGRHSTMASRRSSQQRRLNKIVICAAGFRACYFYTPTVLPSHTLLLTSTDSTPPPSLGIHPLNPMSVMLLTRLCLLDLRSCV